MLPCFFFFLQGPGRKPMNRYEKRAKEIQEFKKKAKGQKAVTISIEGRNMAL